MFAGGAAGIEKIEPPNVTEQRADRGPLVGGVANVLGRYAGIACGQFGILVKSAQRSSFCKIASPSSTTLPR